MEHPAIDRAFKIAFPGDSRQLGVEEKLEKILDNSHNHIETALVLEALCEGAVFYAGTCADEQKLCRTRDHIESLLEMDIEWDEITSIPSLLHENRTLLEIRRELLRAA